MRYLKVLKNLLFAISENNESETLDFAQELCNLVLDKIEITDHEAEITLYLFDELVAELKENYK